MVSIDADELMDAFVEVSDAFIAIIGEFFTVAAGGPLLDIFNGFMNNSNFLLLIFVLLIFVPIWALAQQQGHGSGKYRL